MYICIYIYIIVVWGHSPVSWFFRVILNLVLLFNAAKTRPCGGATSEIQVWQTSRGRQGGAPYPEFVSFGILPRPREYNEYSFCYKMYTCMKYPNCIF